MSGPRAAKGRFPYLNHRTLAELWANQMTGQPRSWCAQCERRVAAAEAARCGSKFCDAKVAA